MPEALRDLVQLSIVVDPTYDQNCYVLRRRDTRSALVLDPGLQHPRTLELLEREGLACERILLTHGHPDHVNGVPAVKSVHGCEAAIHAEDRPLLEWASRLPGIPADLPPVICEGDLVPGETNWVWRTGPVAGAAMPAPAVVWSRVYIEAVSGIPHR